MPAALLAWPVLLPLPLLNPVQRRGPLAQPGVGLVPRQLPHLLPLPVQHPLLLAVLPGAARQAPMVSPAASLTATQALKPKARQPLVAAVVQWRTWGP